MARRELSLPPGSLEHTAVSGAALLCVGLPVTGRAMDLRHMERFLSSVRDCS